MKKVLFSLFLVLAFALSLAATAFAAPPRLVDSAGLLSEGDAAQLLSALDTASGTAGMDVVVVTTDRLGELSAAEFADDFYDRAGYGTGEDKSGVLLLVCMGTRDVYISTKGQAIQVFDDFAIDFILDSIISDLGSGDYYSAFADYAGLCAGMAENYDQPSSYSSQDGDYYGYGGSVVYTKAPFNASSKGILSLVIGFIAALISTGIMKRKLKTVRKQTNASEYVVPGSLNISRSRDVFLYHTVNRVRKPEQNRSGGGRSTTHFSSSGSIHGGGGRKF